MKNVVINPFSILFLVGMWMLMLNIILPQITFNRDQIGGLIGLLVISGVGWVIFETVAEEFKWRKKC